MKIVENRFDLDPAYPFQINRYELKKAVGNEVSYHWHACLEITYIENGSIDYFAGAHSFTASAGDFILFNHAEPHGWMVNSAAASVLAMVFSSDFIAGSPESFAYRYLSPFIRQGSSFVNFIPSADPDAGKMAETIKEIFQEYLRQDDGWQLMVKADVLRFLTFLTRSHTETAASSGIAPDEKAAAMRQLETVFLYVYRHYPEKITLQEMAGLVDLSSPYFSRRFRELTGRTFSDYLIDVRLGHARQLLRETAEDTASISRKCGFTNLSNFYRLYRKHFGSVPGRERKDQCSSSPSR